MQRDARGLAPALQAVMHHLRAQRADLLGLEAEDADEEGPVREVDDRAREGLVQRGVGGAEAREAGARAQRGGEGAAKREERVFRGVVVVDWEGWGAVSGVGGEGMGDGWSLRGRMSRSKM